MAHENPPHSTPVTAALVVIGDEILSGRTKDKNIGFVADYLTAIGIDLREVRIVPDEIAEIAGAVNALRARFSYVFTTGGIGPTHDDLTAEAVAVAFGVDVVEDPRIISLLLQWMKPEDLNPARRRMARIPSGAELVENIISKVPGFRIGNVIVMAGVPSIMQAMLASVAPTLETGPRTVSLTIAAGSLPEGVYAGDLFAIATLYPELSIGSYPSIVDGRYHNDIVVRGKNPDDVVEAAAKIEVILRRLQSERV